MLGLAEYAIARSEIAHIAEEAEEALHGLIDEDTSKTEAVRLGYARAAIYAQQYELILRRHLDEIARNAVAYHKARHDIDAEVDELANSLVNNFYEQRYYGMTVGERLRVNSIRTQRNIAQSALVGPEKVADTWTKRVPFGAQMLTDQRLLLGSAVKVEQDAARMMAKEAGADLIRWMLSPRHSRVCECDARAKAVQKEVVTHIEESGAKIDPRGLYFADQLPDPPHPNCQCEYGIVTKQESKRGAIHRTIQAFKSLLGRLRRR